MASKKKPPMTIQITQDGHLQVFDNSQWRMPTDLEWERIYNEMRPASNPAVKAILDQGNEAIENKQGVTNWERFTIKNFAANKAMARKYLEKLGYEVKEIPGEGPVGKYLSFNFAVRKNKYSPWRFVDPSLSWDDPIGSLLDFGKDITDLTMDIVNGSITGAATTGALATTGPLGAVVAGGGVGGSLEHIRQGAGALMGIPQTPDVSQSAMVGLASAAAPGVQQGMGQIGRGIGALAGGAYNTITDAAAELQARIASVRQVHSTILPEEAWIERAMDPAKRLPSKFDAARQIVDQVLTKIKAPRIQEGRDAGAISRQLTENGVTLNLRPVIDDLVENTLKPSGQMVSDTAKKRVITLSEAASASASESQNIRTPYTPLASGGRLVKKTTSSGMDDVEAEIRRMYSDKATTRTTMSELEVPRSPAAAAKIGEEPNLPALSSDVIGRIEAYLNSKGLSSDAVPFQDAEVIKRMLQGIANKKGAYRDIPVSSQFSEMISGSASAVKRGLEGAADNWVNPQTGQPLTDSTGRVYSQIMDALDSKMRLRRGIIKYLGIPDRPKLQDMDYARAEKRVASLYGEDNGAALRFFQDLEKQFPGAELEKPVRRATIGAMVGKRGELPTAPRITATGALLGTGFAGGAGAGLNTLAGGDPMTGAMSGAALFMAGLGLGSPRVQMAATRGALATANAVRSMANTAIPVTDAMAQASKPAWLQTLNSAVRNLQSGQITGQSSP